MDCMWFESARGTFGLGSNEAGVDNIVRNFLIYTICCVSTTSQDNASWKHGLHGSYSKHEGNFTARIFLKENLEHRSRILKDTIECISGKWILKIWNGSGSVTIICSASIGKAALVPAPRLISVKPPRAHCSSDLDPQKRSSCWSRISGQYWSDFGLNHDKSLIY
jgi:hypothetical protein